MMESTCDLTSCAECISGFVCTCMKVTEDELIRVIVSQGIRDLRELRNETGAGDGCMACRRRLQHYVNEHAARPGYRGRVTSMPLELVVSE